MTNINALEQRNNTTSELLEQTRSGPVFTPAVDIFEDEQKISILADMPGVKHEDLKIDLREDTLTLIASVESSNVEGESKVYEEYQVGTYYRQFLISDKIDQSKIEAKLVDGVLTLALPKAQHLQPRLIKVSAV